MFKWLRELLTDPNLIKKSREQVILDFYNKPRKKRKKKQTR